MGKTKEKETCKHCKKEIIEHRKVEGLSLICPHCSKPSGNGYFATPL